MKTRKSGLPIYPAVVALCAVFWHASPARADCAEAVSTAVGLEQEYQAALSAGDMDRLRALKAKKTSIAQAAQACAASTTSLDNTSTADDGTTTTTTVTGYDDGSETTVTELPDGTRTVTTSADSGGFVVSGTDEDGTVTTVFENPDGSHGESVTRHGETTTTTHHADGSTTVVTTGSDGNVTASETSGGPFPPREPDSLLSAALAPNVDRTRNPDGSFTNTYTDDDGNVIATDEIRPTAEGGWEVTTNMPMPQGDSHSRRTVYDADGNRISEQDVMSWGDGSSEVTDRHNDGTEVTTRVDASGQVTERTTTAEGVRTVETFDGHGNVERRETTQGDTTVTELTAGADAGTRVVTTRNGDDGYTREIIRPDNSEDTVHVDADGRVSDRTQTADDGSTVYTTYDADGNATVIETDADGNVIRHEAVPAEGGGRPLPPVAAYSY